MARRSTYLDFEQLIGELEDKLASMEQIALQNGLNVADETEALKKRIKSLTIQTFAKLTPWQRVQLSRHPNRPYTMDHVHEMTKEFVELHGDRLFKDDKAIVGGLADVGGHHVMLIGHQKGRNTKERQHRNFGMPNPEGYRKVVRLMKLAEKFARPVIILVDTPGAYPGMGAEERGQAEAIAKSMYEMFRLQVPIISVIIGEGASGGAIAMAAADQTLMMENTWYSVISPESCSSILWRSWDYKEQAAEMLKLTAKDMYANGLIDGIVAEPLGGAHRHWSSATKQLKSSILKALATLEKLPIDQLVAKRREKFSKFGRFQEKGAVSSS